MIQAALFDVDGTLVDGRVWRGILEHPARSRAKVAWHYTRAFPRLLRLKLDPAYETRFRDRWVRGLAWLLKGWAPEETAEMADWIANDFLRAMYRQDVIELVQQHRSQGHRVVLVSTMFPVVLSAIARRIGADDVVGSACAVRDGRLTGRLDGESCVGPRKQLFASAYLAANYPEITLAQCAAYADSYSDVPLLRSVAQPCAVYPDPELQAVAAQHGWRVHPAL